MAAPLVIDLCSGTGAWSAPFRAQGFDVVQIDTRNGPMDDVRVLQHDAMGMLGRSHSTVYGVLAAPPCTEFAISGARWWASKHPALLADAVEIVRACLHIVQEVKPRWWALENPKGRIQRVVPELGAPSFYFHPWEYGDFHMKLTYIWGNIKKPPRPENLDIYIARELAKDHPYDIQHIARDPNRDLLRAATPPGFAQAFAAQVIKQFPP